MPSIPSTDVPGTDPIEQLHARALAVQTQLRKRLGAAAQTPDGAVPAKALGAVIDADVMPLVISTIEALGQLRNGTADAIADLDERVGAVEGDATIIVPEDADIIRAVLVDQERLLAIVRGEPASAEEREALTRSCQEHAAALRQLLDECVVEDEGEDDEQDED